MLLYYITDRKQFTGSNSEQRRLLLAKIGEAAAAGIDYIQLRERDLSARELERLAGEAMAILKSCVTTTRLLVNSRVDIALTAGADGVHLRSDDIAASEARAIARERSNFLVAVSCHNVDEVRGAWSHGADFVVFGPVFETHGRAAVGVAGLSQACVGAPGFVMALGGVTIETAKVCQDAGAAGIAGIRMFQSCDCATLVASMKNAAAQNRKTPRR